MNWKLISFCSLLTLISGTAQAQNQVAQVLKSEPVVLEKTADVLTPPVTAFLKSKNPETARIWVFFNDKGILRKEQFAAAASQVKIDEHALARRKKVGLESVTFADLPVSQKYIDAIVAAGGKFRRASRWLNAASFEIPHSRLSDIAALPFVNNIRPVAGYFPERDITSEPESVLPQFKPMAADALSYGSSYNQLQMVNAPAMHNLGFKGSGVIVAMLDTGYLKSHQAFAAAFSESRMLAEYDFIFDDGNTQNEAVDAASQHNHGTLTWSTLGGQTAGTLYGPAYGASFLLAKTEDVRSETPVEEDNWVAALEWADSLGADVISSSLGYSDWYSYSSFDGQTAITSIAAGTAASLGIVVCNSMGNSGPSAATLSAPADAFDIIACGAVDALGYIAQFSSRGPTFDGRIKPEVCAQGVNTYCAGTSSNTFYTTASGTSLSTPLVGGGVALLLSANPNLTPLQVRSALMQTASQAGSPNNNYGWGIIDLVKAYNWGANFRANTRIGFDSLTVQFTDSSLSSAYDWKWYFGDGDSSSLENPVHTYDALGLYDVTLVVQSSEGTLTRVKENYIAVVADTVLFVSDSVDAGGKLGVSVYLRNTQSLNVITLPLTFAGALDLTLDSIKYGARTGYFELLQPYYLNNFTKQVSLEMVANNGGGAPQLSPGFGEVAKLYFTAEGGAIPGEFAVIDSATISTRSIRLTSPILSFAPRVTQGYVICKGGLRGDANGSGGINILDATYLLAYLYKGGSAPPTTRSGDADSSGVLNILDVTFLISYLYKSGPPPGA